MAGFSRVTPNGWYTGDDASAYSRVSPGGWQTGAATGGGGGGSSLPLKLQLLTGGGMLIDIVKKGATDRSVEVRVIDSTTGLPETAVAYNTPGVDLWYRREGATRTAITEATLATTDAAHSDGGFIHVSDGYCRLDLPDAAFAAGANYVDVGGTFTDMIVIGGRVRLVNFDLEDAVRGGLTALPNAAADAAGGLPISDAGGLDLDAKIGAMTYGVANALNVNATHAAGTAWNSGGITEATFATTTGSFAPLGISRQGTAQSATATTLVLDASSPFADNSCIGSQLEVLGSTQGYWQSVEIIDYDNATDTATIEAWPGATPSGTITFKVRGTAPATTAGLAAVSDAVWDEATAGHSTAGSTGKALTDALADTNELQTDWANGGRLDLILDARASQTSVDDLPTNAELATALAAADDAVLAAIAALNNLSAAQVNAEVVDALATDTYAEPASVPAATASLASKIGFLTAMVRNRKTQTADTTTLRNDADSGNIGTSTVSDDATTAVVGEWV